MNPGLEKFIEGLITIILPITVILWAIGRRFDGLDKEIVELKERINKLEDKINQDYGSN